MGYLADRAELSVRMVTFLPFRDSQGNLLLARTIHETDEEPPAVARRPAGSAPTAEDILAMADQNGIGGVMRTLHATAVELGLYVRPLYKSIMYAPPVAKTRCLFTVWMDRRPHEPGFAKAYIATESFEQFYGIKEADVAAAVGPNGYVTLDQATADRMATGLRKLMAAKDAG